MQISKRLKEQIKQCAESDHDVRFHKLCYACAHRLLTSLVKRADREAIERAVTLVRQLASRPGDAEKIIRALQEPRKEIGKEVDKLLKKYAHG